MDPQEVPPVLETELVLLSDQAPTITEEMTTSAMIILVLFLQILMVIVEQPTCRSCRLPFQQ